jgi:hypothetical protein
MKIMTNAISKVIYRIRIRISIYDVDYSVYIIFIRTVNLFIALRDIFFPKLKLTNMMYCFYSKGNENPITPLVSRQKTSFQGSLSLFFVPLLVLQVSKSLFYSSKYYQIFLRDSIGDRKIAEDVDFESLSSIIDRNVETGVNALSNLSSHFS